MNDHAKHVASRFAATHADLRNQRFELEGIKSDSLPEAKAIAARNTAKMRGAGNVRIVAAPRSKGSRPSVRFDASDFLHTPSVQ